MPPLTLHILPPAFALPSISADCIAALAYIRYTQQYGTWIVVADAAEYPNRVAPFLTLSHHHTEPVPKPLEGLEAIIQHLKHATSSSASLEIALNATQHSHAIALTSHFQIRLTPLVALSLYASSDNYSSTTRPAFGTVLPFPESWILPHRLHKQALESCAHLGIEFSDLLLLGDVTVKSKTNSLDADSITGEDAIPDFKSEEKPNPTIAAKLKLQRRIDDLVYSALAPFDSALGARPDSSNGSNGAKAKARWLFSASLPTQADILALSLLSLAVLPYSSGKESALSNPFLSTSIRKQFPELISGYLIPGLDDAFGGKTSYEQALFSAPLAASAAGEDDEDDGAYEDAIQGYGNLDIGSGRIEIPWRRRRKGDTWESVQRVGNAISTVVGDAFGLSS